MVVCIPHSTTRCFEVRADKADMIQWLLRARDTTHLGPAIQEEQRIEGESRDSLAGEGEASVALGGSAVDHQIRLEALATATSSKKSVVSRRKWYLMESSKLIVLRALF